MRVERRADGRRYGGRRPFEAAAEAIGHASSEGFALELRPETPVIPDEAHLERGIAAGIWQEIDGLHGSWADAGCHWVNLRFGIDDGAAIVRVEANPTGSPLPDGVLPDLLPGFDCHRLLSAAELESRHPRRGRTGN